MPDPKPRSLLLVEDSDPTARVLRVFFHQRENYDVYWASTLAEAAPILPSAPDAVLLDLMLPDGRGEDFIERIRDESPNSRIIVVTALPRDSARVTRVHAMLPDAVIHKPYDMDELIAAVKGPAPPPPFPPVAPAPNPEPIPTGAQP